MPRSGTPTTTRGAASSGVSDEGRPSSTVCRDHPVPKGATSDPSPALFFLLSQGLVGISLNCDWGEPVDISNPKDVEAAERYLQFCLGWFANPIYSGDYPQVMKDRIGEPAAGS